MKIRFTQAARRHRIGRSSARYVMSNTDPTFVITSQGTPGWRWVGDDERGRQLEVIGVEVRGEGDPAPFMLVIHVMPTHERKEPS